MDLNLEGKVAIVTGGSKGIGKAIALELAKEGVDVAICARTLETLESTAKELADEVGELREYIRGGKDSEHKQLREAYHHIPKPQARKIMKYLGGILEDAVRYSNDRKPGRRKKGSK